MRDLLCGFNVIKKLGEGVYAAVYLVEGDLAIKKLNIIDIDFLDIYNEIDILSQVEHPNVVSANKILFNKDDICLVMPLGQINLKNYIKSKFNELNDNHKTFLSDSLKRGLDYLHQNFILHLDLHADNIILYQENNVLVPKIADFGLSKYGLGPYEKESINFKLAPPEVLLTLIEKSTPEVGPEFDNWYLGSVIYLIWNRKYPFRNRSKLEVLAMIGATLGLTKEQEAKFSKHANHLTKIWSRYKICINNDLLVSDPTKRIISPDQNQQKKYLTFSPKETKIYKGLTKKLLLDWLWDKTEDLFYPPTVYFEAVEILEQIIDNINIKEGDLQLTALVALNLATILLDNPCNLEELLDENFSRTSFKKLRTGVIQHFGGKLFRPTLDMLNPELSVDEVMAKYYSN